MNTEILTHVNNTFIEFIKQRFDDKTAETIVQDWMHPYIQFKLQNDRNCAIYKKPTTAFNFFVDANRQLVGQKTGLSDDNLIRELKNIWKKLNKETRETYINMNLLLKQEYEKTQQVC